MSETIVSFSAPPVVEVVAGVGFEDMGPGAGPLMAAFWIEKLREEFPALQQQPPYTPPLEQFQTSGGSFNFPFEIGVGVMNPRLWVSRDDEQELLQLQPGWFACNWRKVRPEDEYDHWQKRREAFGRWFSALSNYLVEAGAGQPKVTQCEVTYINHIVAGGVWQHHREFDRIFDVTLTSSAPYTLEQVSAQAQFLLARDGEQPYGRLHAKILPAYGRDGRTPLYVFELTARGAPLGDGLDGATQFLNLGREAIDRTFLALTTAEMHQEWGIER